MPLESCNMYVTNNSVVQKKNHLNEWPNKALKLQEYRNNTI